MRGRIRMAGSKRAKPGYLLPRLIGVLSACLILAYLASSCSSKIAEKPPGESPYQPLPGVETVSDPLAGKDLSVFKHDSEQHKNTPCMVCHVRNEGETRVKLPGHASCSGCHAPVFDEKTERTEQAKAMCAICHTAADSEEVKAFRTLANFNVKFDHRSHSRMTNCGTCHNVQGVGVSVPTGGNAHATCFSCHSPEKVVADKNIGSCSTCHEAGRPDRFTDATPSTAGNFSHAKHRATGCATCHQTARSGSVSAPLVAMHTPNAKTSQSCATCHNNKRAFGGDDFTDCKRCHTGKNFSF